MTNNASPKISIIIAVYNGAKTLQQCIDSVANQSYADVELIIIDGGSKDGTVDLLKANQMSISYWISEPDRGIYNAWNKALKKATGEWVHFLGSDDFLWDEMVVERVITSLRLAPPDVNLVYGQIMLLSECGLKLYLIGESWEKVGANFKYAMTIPHQGVMHRRRLFEIHGMFDESFQIAGDYELLLRELKYAEAVFIPGIIMTGMRQGGISSNPKNSILALLESRRAQKLHGEKFPSLLWTGALIRVYLRLILWWVLGDTLGKKVIDIIRGWVGLPRYWTHL